MEGLKKSIDENNRLLDKLKQGKLFIEKKGKVPQVNSKQYPFTIEKCKYSGKMKYRFYQAYGCETSLYDIKSNDLPETLNKFNESIAYYSTKIKNLKSFLCPKKREAFKKKQEKAIEAMERAIDDVTNNYYFAPDCEVYKEVMGLSMLRHTKTRNY